MGNGTTTAPTAIKVSVIVPLFNVEEFITETLEGLLHQTLSDVEFLLIDDGSTDNTYEIAKQYAQQHSQISVVRQENSGPAAARNHGLRLARGEFICFVDSDDILVADALENMYNAAITYDAQVVTGETLRFNNTRTWRIGTYVRYGVNKPGLKYVRDHPELFYALGPCAKLFQREPLENVYFPEHIRLGEDQPFVLYAYKQAQRVYTVDQVVYYYRAREGQTQSLTQRAMAEPQAIIDDLFDMMLAARDILSESDELLSYYISRVMRFDILPRIRAALRTGDTDIQKATLQATLQRVKSLSKQDFKAAPYLYTYMSLGIAYLTKYLDRKMYGLAVKLIVASIQKLPFRNYTAFFHTVAPSLQRWMNKYVRKFNMKFHNFLLRQIIFRISKYLFPLQKKKIVFGTNRSEQLEGNLQTIYNQVTQEYPEWSTEVFGKKPRKFWERARLYHHLGTAKLVVLDDYYSPLYGLHVRGGSEVIQTWHGAGAFKKFGLSATGSADSNSPAFEYRAHSSYTKVLASSTNIAGHYAEAFGVDKDKVLPLGVPKTDRLVNQREVEKAKQSFFEKYPHLQNKTLILYAPTFRGKPAQRRGYNLQLNVAEMRQKLGDEYAVILKLHPMVQQSMNTFYDLGDFVVDLSAASDITDLLMVADMLVTDYSSLVFDFSLLHRPILFYAYDLEDYLSERGFYYEYEDFVPGPISTTTTDLIEDIKNQRYSLKKVYQFASYFFEHQDGKSTERFVEYFLGPLQDRSGRTQKSESDNPYILVKTN